MKSLSMFNSLDKNFKRTKTQSDMRLVTFKEFRSSKCVGKMFSNSFTSQCFSGQLKVNRKTYKLTAGFKTKPLSFL